MVINLSARPKTGYGACQTLILSPTAAFLQGPRMSQTPSSDPADKAAALFKRLANPMRLSLILALRDGPRSVGALQEAVGASQPVVSVQLSRMRGDGLVTCQRTDADARIMLYALADPRVLDLIDLAAVR